MSSLSPILWAQSACFTPFPPRASLNLSLSRTRFIRPLLAAVLKCLGLAPTGATPAVEVGAVSIPLSHPQTSHMGPGTVRA